MNNSAGIYIAINWLAVFLYILATIANVYGILFNNRTIERRSYYPCAAGLLLHTAALGYWWRIVGHGPYMAPSEVLSSDAWMAVVVYFLFRRFFPRISPASILVFPATFLMVALANFNSPGIRSLPPTFSSIWLIFHIGFYKIALGTLLIACAFSLFVVLKERGMQAVWLEKLPDLPALDLNAYRFAGFGFIFWAIGMLAGSIWAYKSWGRYWGWDPVETWSLITWLIFGIYLHLRRSFRWQGSKAARFFFLCFFMSLIASFVTSHMGSSIHAEYFK
jgi:cytochrome c-type biogenesis protein CcsB